MCCLTDDILSVAFDPETGEICWLIVTECMKIQHFPSFPGFPHKATESRPTKFCEMLDSLTAIRCLLSTAKIWGISPQKSPQPKLSFLANTFFATSALDTVYLRNHISQEQNVASINKILVLVLLRWQEFATRSVAVFFDMLSRCRWQWRISGQESLVDKVFDASGSNIHSEAFTRSQLMLSRCPKLMQKWVFTALAQYMLRPCVHPSVCHKPVLYWKRLNVALQTVPHSTSGTLVFCCQRCWWNLNGVTPSGGAKYRLQVG